MQYKFIKTRAIYKTNQEIKIMYLFDEEEKFYIIF
jgi:hypothetical protein